MIAFTPKSHDAYVTHTPICIVLVHTIYFINSKAHNHLLAHHAWKSLHSVNHNLPEFLEPPNDALVGYIWNKLFHTSHL